MKNLNKAAGSKSVYRVGIYTTRGMPVQVDTMPLRSKSEEQAQRNAMRRVRKTNPDKPRGYFMAATTGYGSEGRVIRTTKGWTIKGTKIAD